MSSLKRSASSSSIPILRRDGSSMIPVISREGSSHSLTKRESKLTVRQSRTSEARAKQTHQMRNSKSMDRFSSKLTTPLVTNRARSSTRTPITSGNKKITWTSSKSPLSSAVSVKKIDKRPINDKDWQKQQLIKVQNFLFIKFQITEKVKAGISIEMFVGIINLLFKSIDERINITKENYVEEVPARLKCYRYPAAVKPSLMKTVNVPHSWAHIIAVLSWLVDLIEKLDSINTKVIKLVVPETTNSRDATLFMVKVKAHFDLVVQRQNNEDEAIVFKEYEQNLRAIYEVNSDNLEKCKNEIEVLKEQLTALTEQENDIFQKNQDYKNKIEIIKTNIENCNFNKTKMQENLKISREKVADKKEKLDKKREQLYESILQLKEIISNQQYSTRTRKEFLQKLADFKFTKNLKEERLKELKEISDRNDLKLAENRRTVQTIINKINNVIKDAKRIKPDIAIETLRETKFTDPEFLNEMEKFKVQYEKEKNDSVKRLQEMDEIYQRLIDVKSEVTKKSSQLAKEVRQEELDFEETERKLFESQYLIKAELQDLKKKVENAVRVLDEVQHECKMSQEANQNAREKLEEFINVRKEKSEKIYKFQTEVAEKITKACLSVSQNRRKEMQLVMEVTNGIYDANDRIVKQVKEFLISLEKSNEDLKKDFNLINNDLSK
ncbi:kinetochore protein NDC80 homolog [Agrilus planipennis]|uniref:Kinetochore protein NDC80 n=1 Tax=Agrilus planipennis TaxID=224129 RepID=A0A7F5RG81_AGRPL|nr:kinetochore protein NDC80 homolog [Agrilus planipennis]